MPAVPLPADEAVLRQLARRALACLDLTSLNESDSAADIVALCARAVGPPGRGATAAVCVWPRFAALARRRLPSAVRVAAVANFPAGGSNTAEALRDVQRIVAAGAQEVDVVMPYRELAAAPELLRAVRQASRGLTLKVILETGELGSEAVIQEACRIALAAGADFLKTSTGKVKVNATPEAARLLLQAVAAFAPPSAGPAHRAVGFKPAGGIRTVADAAAYMALTAEVLGEEAVQPGRFRIGASGLLNEIEAVLLGTAVPRRAEGY